MTWTPLPLLTVALVAISLTAGLRPATAAWPHDPNSGNLPLCTATNDQRYPAIIPDGAGGTIVAWHDDRIGTSYNIYAQRISAGGTPLWTANGVALCTASGDQLYPTLASDGAGGAIVTWHDQRAGVGSTDIYAQRISSAGAVQWTANGVALCTATSDQTYPTIVSDGASGAIVTWYDYRGGAASDIYVQRISAGGTVQWTANGVALCTATNSQYAPLVVSDGTGGAIVTWYDQRSGNSDIYAQRVSGTGTPQWTANGVALGVATGSQSSPAITADGSGGAIVTWHDYRGGISYDIYAQRISADGTVQWVANGVAVCVAAGNQTYPTIATDGAGGAISTWQDDRNGDYDIYAQRISAGGTVQWTTSGVALCTAADNQSYPVIISDDTGGTIVTWYDKRGGTNTDIYAQRISATGAVQWTANGVALCTALGDQRLPALTSDGAGGAVVAWGDFRNGTEDIYAQRVERYGQLGNPEPVITGVEDVANDQGGFVKLSWNASYLDADPIYGVYEYRVFRSAPVSLAMSAVSRRAVTEDSDVAVREGALLALASTGTTVYWEYVGTQAAEVFAGYSRVVATTSDSIAGSNPRTLFMVEARASTSLSADRWASAPDSGYSVDDLAPAAPAPFTGEFAEGTAYLQWGASAAPDLAEYRLYRGGTAGFVPGPGNLVVAQSDIGYVDAAGAPFYYKLCAVDIHGNVSGFSTLLPSGTADVTGAALPRAVFLAPPAPNPARGATTLRFGLPRAAHVELALYDQQGRRVRSLLSGTQPAGERTITWNGCDESGRALPAGLYFVRLASEGRTFVSRLAVIR
jgi:hypothetical protein